MDAPTSTIRVVANYGMASFHGGPAVLACSVPDDRAIVGAAVLGTISDLRAIRLSGGEALSAPGLAFPADATLPGVVVSSDGRLVGFGSTANVTSSAANHFVVRDIDTGALLASIDGGIAAFSDDGSRILTVEYVGNSNARAVYSVIDWQTERTVWSQELPTSVWKTRPGTGDLLIEPIENLSTATTRAFVSTPFVVHADGSTQAFPKEVRPPID